MKPTQQINDIDYWALLIERTVKQHSASGESIDWTRPDMSMWGVYNELLQAVMSLHDLLSGPNHQGIVDSCSNIGVLALALGTHSLYKLSNAQGVSGVMKHD